MKSKTGKAQTTVVVIKIFFLKVEQYNTVGCIGQIQEEL